MNFPWRSAIAAAQMLASIMGLTLPVYVSLPAPGRNCDDTLTITLIRKLCMFYYVLPAGSCARLAMDWTVHAIQQFVDIKLALKRHNGTNQA